MNGRFDVAVVGRGIVGLAHALAAARAGKRVVVIDRTARATGASTRTSAPSPSPLQGRSVTTGGRWPGLGLPVAIGRFGVLIAPLLLTTAYQWTGKPGSALAVLMLLAVAVPIASLVW